ncbi:glycosyltransferase [archaeon]|jgi:glycosyltransferase involved in cell wall biosynthesis|nr:glycosyltransferase [archaeon]MBT4416512.1 glycosyltransferase [archaeon]
MPKLSIVIPASNEENRMPTTLKNYINYFDKELKDNYEIVIIPNNCQDKTPELTQKLARKHSQVNFTNAFKDKFIGKGGAVVEGFKIAQGDYIGYVDADGSTPPEYFYDLLHNIAEKDGIIASRWIEGAEIGKKQNIQRQIASRTFNLLIKTMFGLKVKDSQCGAKIFKNKAAKSVINQIITNHWAFDVDLLYTLKRKGFNITEIPTKWDDAEGSQLDVKKASQNMLKSIIRLRMHHSPFRRWQKK